jgi:hypothetical protein
MKFPQTYFCTIAGLLMTSGCASLTTSQLSEVNAFGQITSHFSAYPGKIISTYDAVHQQQELFYANSEPDPQSHLTALADAYNFKKITDLINPKIDLSFQIIDQYAQELVLLTSQKNSLALDTVSKTLGSNLDNLVIQYNKVEPSANLKSGLGSAAAALVQLGGDAYIKVKQAEEVRKIVPQADEVIIKMTDNILEFLDPVGNGNGTTLKSLLQSERGQVTSNYKAYLNPYTDHVLSGAQSVQPSQWGNIEHRRFASLDDDRLYITLLQDLDNAEALRIECIAAIKSLRAAHHKLTEDIAQKQNLKDRAGEIQTYGDDLKNMINTIKAIK